MGASPGASTGVKIMLDVVEKAFPEILETEAGQAKMKKMIPTWKTELNETLFKENLKRSEKILGLQNVTY